MNVNAINAMIGSGSINTVNNSIKGDTGGAFRDILAKTVDALNSTEKAISNDVYKLLANNDVNLHDIMIATEKADITLQLTIQIRNKIIDAYNEIMRMQV